MMKSFYPLLKDDVIKSTWVFAIYTWKGSGVSTV
jgi:hypothetical protein